MNIINPVAKNSSFNTTGIENLLKNSNIEFVSVNPFSNYYDVKLKDGGNVYISFKKDISIQISSLTAILKQLTINGKRFNIIDFRFEKPLISY